MFMEKDYLEKKMNNFKKLSIAFGVAAAVTISGMVAHCGMGIGEAKKNNDLLEDLKSEAIQSGTWDAYEAECLDYLTRKYTGKEISYDEFLDGCKKMKSDETFLDWLKNSKQADSYQDKLATYEASESKEVAHEGAMGANAGLAMVTGVTSAIFLDKMFEKKSKLRDLDLQAACEDENVRGFED